MVLKEMGLQPLVIDINDDILETFIAKEGDYKSRGIALQILKNRQETNTTGITVEFYAKPADGKVYMVTAEEKDATKGMYEIIYPTSILQPGIVKCEIRLVNQEDDEIITTKQFELKVYSSIANDDIFEGVDVEPLIEVLTKAARNEEERIQAENERIQAENTRIQNENERKSNEQIRQQKEDERQQNEIIRQTNEQTRQQNEQQRVALYNALKDLDVSQYELRLQKLEHDTSIEETVVEEAYGPVIPLPENVVNGQINDIKIEGKTYRNILEDYFGKSDSWERLDGELIDNDFIKATADATYKGFWLKAGIITLKPNTQYTIFVEVRKNTLTGSGLRVTGTDQKDPFGELNAISPGETGIFKFLVTTKSDLTNTLPLRMFVNSTATSGEIEFRIMLLEGDYTNENISYIRGTKSTISAIRLKSVGKNLLNIKNTYAKASGYIITDTGYIRPAGRTGDIQYILEVEKDAYYTVSRKILQGNSRITVRDFYTNEYLVSYTSSPTSTFKATSDKVILFFDTKSTHVNEITEVADIQVEKGTQATEYEPYKESTLYVIAKDEEGNILELRSLPNGTKDEINVANRKLIKQIGEKANVSNGTVINFTDMAEGGTYFAWNENGETETGTKGDTLGIDATVLIYQLAEPIEMPVEVFGNLQSYENGAVYVETIIPRVDFYTSEGIVLEENEPPIKEIDVLYLVDKETGVLTSLDTSKAFIFSDGKGFTHPDLYNDALVDWDYVPDVESTRGSLSMKLPTNLKASVTSTLQGVQELSNKTKKLDTRVIANRRDIYNLQDNFATLQSDVFGISNELNTHISENSRKHISESGENVNGRYIKFDDGTMIVYMPDISVIGDDSSFAQIPVPFPHTFSEIPVVFSAPKRRVRVSDGAHITSRFFTAIPVNVSHSQISNLRFMYGDSSNLESDYEFIVDVIAIGRWK